MENSPNPIVFVFEDVVIDEGVNAVLTQPSMLITAADSCSNDNFLLFMF